MKCIRSTEPVEKEGYGGGRGIPIMGLRALEGGKALSG